MPRTRLLQRLAVRILPQTMLRLQRSLSQRSVGEAHAQVRIFIAWVAYQGH